MIVKLGRRVVGMKKIINAKINKLKKERKGEMGERNGWRKQKRKAMTLKLEFID